MTCKTLIEVRSKLFEANKDQAIKTLKTLRDLCIYDLQDDLPYPLPMFADDAWTEVLDLIIEDKE